MSTIPYFLKNPALDPMAAQPLPPETQSVELPQLQRVQMQSAPVVPQKIAHALTVADHMGGPVAPTPEPQGDALQPVMQHLQGRLQKDYEKDANPYGSPQNHPGFFGKIAHGLSVAAGFPNLRREEEQGLEKQLGDVVGDQSKNAYQGATTAHLNAETPEVAPNAESTRNEQGANVRNIESQIRTRENPQPNLATAYAHAVNQAIAAGQDPAQDPIVQHLSDAITNLQKQPAEKGLSYQTAIGPDGKPHVFGLDAQGNKVADIGEHYERPMNINMVSPGDNSDLIKGIGEYRYAPPNPRTEQGAAILRQVAAQYPDYDASQYESQTANRKYFTSGKGGVIINALNTVSEHLDDAEKNMPSNSSIPLINKVKNAGLTALGEAPTKKWDIDADAIGGEWSKLVSGGVATEGELNHIKGLLNNADSPQAMKAAISEIRALTAGKLAGIQKQVGSAQLQVPARGISSLPSGESQGTIRARDPQGVLHEAPAGTPLPKGWKAE